jgi:hypothetical protein
MSHPPIGFDGSGGYAMRLRDFTHAYRKDTNGAGYENRLRVRFRIDGVLQDVMEPPMRLKACDRFADQGDRRTRHRRAPSAAIRGHQGST